MLDDLDTIRTLVSIVTGGGGAAAIVWLVSRLRKSGWRVGIYLERTEIEELRARVKAAAAATARADAIVREAETRVAKAEATAAHACAQCKAVTTERDALALQIAKGGNHANQ